MNTLGGSRGSILEEEREKLYLDATRKQNKLLDLEIEMKEVELETQKLLLEEIKNKGTE